MTVLSFDKFFRRRQRAKARAADLVTGFMDWCASGDATPPDGWKPHDLEAGFADVLGKIEAAAEKRGEAT
jgi:hypothetical protein